MGFIADDRNNFYKNEKVATIFTPDYVSEFLYFLLKKHIPRRGSIVDPCVGRGSLLEPWKKDGYDVLGIDIDLLPADGPEQDIIRRAIAAATTP